eukprot:c26681_g2_i1 orf=652-3183(+)
MEGETEHEETPLVNRLSENEDDIRSVNSDERMSSLGSESSKVLTAGLWPRLKRAVPRLDSLDVEAMQVSGMHHMDVKDHTLSITLHLAFQSLGVVYGDMGTSPLYVYSSTFSRFKIESSADILGALSIIIYTITVIPLFKYVFIVLRANNNGEGGTLSLYSLICRYAKVNLLPNRQPADEHLSNFKLQVPTKRLERALKIKEKLERHTLWKTILLIFVLVGASLVMGDGILTPCISVMSAVSGLRVALPSLTQDVIVGVSIGILVILFSLQRFGTGTVGFLFAPVLCVWFTAIAVIGLCNICRYEPGVFKAFNPAYIYSYFSRNGFKAWSTLGGLVLCITGGEAMFADLGHFSVRSIQIAFSCIVYPCLLLAYMGQAAYLLRYPSNVDDAFYKSTPDVVFWPMLVIATLAAMIASQAMISATFSVIKMALAIDCFPRVKVVHTSKRFMGQIYIPVINWFLMIMCVVVTACFKSTDQIGNAYGVAVVGDMLVTTSLVTLIMIMIWQTSLFLALGFVLIIGSVELLYLSAVLLKVPEGGWVPLALAAAVLAVMYIWHYGNRMKYHSELEHKISMDYIADLGSNLGTVRVPGVGLLYNELVQGIPSVFGYFISSLPAIHNMIVFVCIKYVPVPVVPQMERFLFRRVGPRNYHLYRCVARYGYKDIRKEDHYIFEQLLIHRLEIFIQQEASEYALEHESFPPESDLSDDDDPLLDDDLSSLPSTLKHLKAPLLSNSAGQNNAFASAVESPCSSDMTATVVPSNSRFDHDSIDSIAATELGYLDEAKEEGVVYLLGHADVRAKKESSFLKKLVINYMYSFLARNCRASTEALSVPHTNLLGIGVTYMV